MRVARSLLLTLLLAAPVARAQDTPAAEAPPEAAEASAGAAAPSAPARTVPQAKSLDELLRLVREGWSEERRENREREARFRAAKDEQARLLAMHTAPDCPGNYGARFTDTWMVFDLVEQEEGEDHYTITLTFRSEGDFAGSPCQRRGQPRVHCEPI